MMTLGIGITQRDCLFIVAEYHVFPLSPVLLFFTTLSVTAVNQ